VSGEPIRLSSLLEAVADGERLDTLLEGLSLSAEEHRLVGHLRLVAAVADVHRTVGADTSDTGGTAGAPDVVHRAGDRWGNLQLTEKLGQGAFGQVWRARDQLLESDVALKLIDERPGRHDVTERVLREGRILARIKHPNVVTIHGVEQHDGQLGLRMEYVRGKTLEQILNTSGPFSDREAALVGQDLCRALAIIHGAGLLHRDLKAENVMREDGGRVVLMDLGSGELQSRAAQSGLAGTPLYLAPEVLAGGEATVQSDLYSLGVLLDHLVTRTYPVRAASLDELCSKHEGGRIERLRDRRPDLSSAFVRVVERATDARKEVRFSTAGEMATALAEAAASAWTSDPPPQSRDIGFSARRRGLAALALFGLVFALVGLWRISGWRSPAGPAAPVRLVAVLPFSVEDQDANSDHIAQGVSMELTASLGQIGGLRVVPWSFMKRLAPAATLEEVVARTHADAVVEGTIQRLPGTPDGRLRVRVQMFERAGTLLWSETFECPLGELLTLQAAIARQISARFAVLLGRREEMLLSRFQRVPADAVELYLKGRQAWEDYRDNFEPAISYLRRAVAIDPQFADAYAALADCYTLQSSFSGITPAREALPRALEAVNQALAINPRLPEAYATRGFAQAILAWNWTAADADYRRALELDPESAAVRTSFSNFLTMLGRHEEAIRENRIAEQRAPFSTVILRRTGWALYMARRYDEAIGQLESVLAIEPTYTPARSLLARAYAMAGMHEQAIRYIEPVDPGFEGLAAQVYAQAGRPDEARRLLAAAVAPGARVNSKYQIATGYAALGDTDAAIEYLEGAFADHDPALVNLGFDPRLDRVRGDPRVQRLLNRMHLSGV
jgi:eukaryotic-like serine/threonine-protein kinase